MSETYSMSGQIEYKQGKVIKVAGQTFSVFKEPELDHVNEGDEVAFSYVVRPWQGREYNNIRGKVRIMGKGGTGVTRAAPSPEERATPRVAASVPYRNRKFPIPLDDADMSIIRQNALTNAREVYTTFYGSSKISPDAAVTAILEMANQFARWTSGNELREWSGAEAPVKLDKQAAPFDDDVPF